jgi:autotransporter-associated beta strand protein
MQLNSGGGVIDTDGFSTTITQGITGSGGLTKRGEGTLTLSGTSTFTGATTLEAGTLALAGALGSTAAEVKYSATLALGGNTGGTVVVRSGGHLALALAANSASQVSRAIGGALVFNSGSVLDLTAVLTPQPGDYIVAIAQSISGTPGTVIAPPGVTASVVVVGNTLHVAIPAGSLAQPPPPPADPDHDGLPTDVEYVLGTDPGSADPSVIQSQLVEGSLVLTFPRTDASETMGLQVAVEAGDDLLTWPLVYQIGATTEASSPGVSISENDEAPDTIIVTIPTGGSARHFARLRVMTE